MNAQLTRRINQLYKTQCLRDKMKGLYDLVNAKYKEGVEDILPELSQNDANFTEVYKLKSKGSTGTVDFTLAFGKAIVRRGERDEKDQQWLQTLDGEYVRTKLELAKSAVKNGLKGGEIDESDLAALDLEEETTMKLTLSAAIDEKTLSAATEEAMDLIGEDVA